MIITLTGVQSSGKTTLLNKLKEFPIMKKFHTIEESIRGISQRYPINEFTNDISQLLICNKHFEDVFGINDINKNIITDRCSIDSYIYSKYLFNHGSISIQTYKYAKYVWELTTPKYDYKFIIFPEFTPVEDGIRSINNSFYDEINTLFEDYYNKHKKDMILIHGSLEDRIHIVMDIILKDINKGLIS